MIGEEEIMVRADLRVFFGESAEGNTAHCFALKRRPSRTRAARLSIAMNAVTCFCWWRRGALHVRCFQSGKGVKFCGHGILGAAVLWTSMQPALRERIANARRALTIYSGRRRFLFTESDGLYWLRLAPVGVDVISLPENVASHFQPPPCAMANAGGEYGYKIFEWPMGTDIARLHIDVGFISSDRRGTILTARSEPDQTADFSLRYLALQYGVDEDAATGSANAVLAEYWSQRNLIGPYQAYQCSQSGGLIFSSMEADGDVTVGGHVRIERI